MTGRPDRTSRPDHAARLDVAIDALLDGRGALLSVDEPEDLELMATARLLHDGLPRFHPRFGFEDLLARRLADHRTGMGRSAVADGPSPAPTAWVEIASPGARGAGALMAGAPGPAPAARVAATPTPRGSLRRRSLVAGGAIASGLSLAIPLAGAALAAWRRSRPSGGIA